MFSLAQGFLLGLGAAVPIGPVNIEIARRTLTGGFRAGFALGCGAVTVDVTYAAITALSLMQFLGRVWLKLPLLVGGSALLAYLGLASIRAGIKAWNAQPTDESRSAGDIRRNYITGLLMTALNPMTLAFWIVAVPSAGARSGGRSLPLVCAGVFLGTLTWVVCFASILTYARRFRQGWWMATADIAGGLILLTFAMLGVVAILRQWA